MRKIHCCRQPAATRRRTSLPLTVTLVVAAAAVWPYAASAQPTPAEENTLKAAFVYNFAKYTDWPDDLWNRSPRLRLCTAGERGEFAQALAALEGKPAVRGKEIEVRQLSRPQDGTDCHILVVVGHAQMTEWTRSVRLAPVLTVGDGEGFATRAGIIALYVEGEKLKFAINQEAAKRAGLKLSSQLLKLARLVKDEQGGTR
ncbi:YfiR family protein [Accumulibacter sp.]|uniref:YfiR family protein n=1 Tax=Accumulibacter sp. TaxID=2053492 RepID=UPI0035B47390